MPIFKNKTAQMEAWQIPQYGAVWPKEFMRFVFGRMSFLRGDDNYQDTPLDGPFSPDHPKIIFRPMDSGFGVVRPFYTVRSRALRERALILPAYPGDWIVELSNSVFYVFDDFIFSLLFESAGMKAVRCIGLGPKYTVKIAGEGSDGNC